MFVKNARYALATVLAAGAVSALPAPVAAAPGGGSCLIGDWTLTRYSMAIKGKDVALTTTGGQGAKLRITRSNAVYDFTGSKRTVTKGVRSGQPVAMWADYEGRLGLKSRFRGTKAGVFTTKPASAAGNAIGTLGQIQPEKKVLGKYSLVETYRRGEWGALTPLRADFKCNARALKFAAKKKDFFGTSVVTIYYRRS